MTRKSRRELERLIDQLAEDGRAGTVETVVERDRAEAAGWPIATGTVEGSRSDRNKFTELPDGEDLVVAHVPTTELTATFGDSGVNA